MTDLRILAAKNRIHRLKLEAIANQLETLDDKDSLTKTETTFYSELVKSYKRLAMAWIKFRKVNNQDIDMIEVNW